MITEKLMRFFPIYFCLADEISTNGTPHTHIFIYSNSPIRFNTLKGRFPTAHIEKCYGSSLENRNYIAKEGKWADTEKAETQVKNTFYEYGELPTETSEKNPKMYQLIEHIRDGKTTSAIIDDTPNLAFRIKDIDALRQVLLSEKYATESRNIEVTYIFGASGMGKTRGIYAKHNPRDICRITNYRTGRGVSFDAYFGQPVLVFEEFYSQIPIEDMLNFIDIYPLFLPARYNDKIACFTKVYITSNMPLEEQYKSLQWERTETWNAFLRRIHTVVEYCQDGTVITKTLNERSEIL